MSDLLFWDIETTKADPWAGQLLCVGYALNDGPVTVLDYTCMDTAYDDELRALLEDPDVVKVEHSKYDMRWFRLAGYQVNGDMHDTMLMAWILNENTPLDLDWLAWRYANIDMDKRIQKSGGVLYFRAETQTLPLADLPDLPLDHPVWAEMFEYNVRDIGALRTLYFKLRQRLTESEWDEYWLTEQVPYTNVLADIEVRGLPVDIPAVEVLAEEMTGERAEVEAGLRADAGLPDSFNLNSQPQLVAYLFSRQFFLTDALVLGAAAVACIKSCLDGEHDDCFEPEDQEWYAGYDQVPDTLHTVDLLPEGFVIDKLGRDRVHGHWSLAGRGLAATPPTKDPKTGVVGKLPSTSSPELLYAHAADPWVRTLCLEYRKLNKLLTTYLTKWPVEAHEGRLYTRFNQTGTVTGRLSSSGPNLQNVPARGKRGKQCRGLFVGDFVIGDYDQLEMRLMAHFSGDRRMTAVFAHGDDPHRLTAEAVFGGDVTQEQRDIGKTLNYAMGYGAGPRKVAQVLSLQGYPTSKLDAKHYLIELADFYRTFFNWKTTTIRRAKDKGSVRTIGGHRRRLKGAFNDVANWRAQGYGERQAVNAIIQGSAADVLRHVMVRFARDVPQLRMLAQVHDELVFEWSGSPPDDYLLGSVQNIAEDAHGFDLKVPLVFEPHVIKTWAEKSGPAIVELFEEDDDA